MNRREITPEELLEIAKKAVLDAETQDEFIVRDLFREIDWRHIPEERRMRAGVLFGDYAESEEGMTIIEKLQGNNAKTEDNQQRYRKL